MAWRNPRLIITAILITAAVWSAFIFRGRWYQYGVSGPESEPHIDVPRYELWEIRDLRANVHVSSMHIRTAFEQHELPLKQDVDASISLTDIDLTQPIPDISIGVATVPAPRHAIPDASSLIIGMATLLPRLRDALPAFALWAAGTRARFAVLVAPPKPGEPSVAEIEQLYSERGIQLKLIESEAGWYDQYVALLAVLYDHADANTKWGCIMDDDTFFFSMKRVLEMLDKHNAQEPYYIGGLSENKETWDRLGYFAYGGAGMFLSIPLLKQLRPHSEACIGMPDDAGDIRIAHCIQTYSTTKFTWEPYLFQMDLHGDVTGFYEAVRTRPVSTHHWKTWHFHDMVQVGAVSKICGNECVLQKYQFADGWMMTNGFSIVKYSYSQEEEMNYIEGAMEHTWADTIWVIPTSWNYTLAPLKPKDHGKIQYIIERTEEEENQVTLYYVKRKDGLGEGIVRMTWEKPS